MEDQLVKKTGSDLIYTVFKLFLLKCTLGPYSLIWIKDMIKIRSNLTKIF